MALQLTGAFKADALSNLQVRLPAVVIGGGLTGIDTATELLAYYPLQVEKIARPARGPGRRHRRGAACTRPLDAEERGILEEFLAHGRAVRAERARAAAAGERARLRAAGARLGRRDAGLPQAAAGRAGLPAEPRGGDEGARGGHHLRRRAGAGRGACPTPTATSQAMAFTHPRATAPRAASSCRRARCSSPPARRPTSPTRRSTRAASRSTARRASSRASAPCSGRRRTVRARARSERLLHVVRARRPLRQLLRRQPSALQRQRREGDGLGQGRLSARRGALRRRRWRRSTRRRSRRATRAWQALVARLDDELLARVERVDRLTPTIVEVIVRAPAAARHFQPGQFYRLQNFERGSVARAHRRSRRGAADGGHRPHRRLGRSRSAACSRSSRSRWACRAGCARTCSRASRWW